MTHTHIPFLLSLALLCSCAGKQQAPDVLAVETETAAECPALAGQSYVGEIEAAATTPVSFTGMGTVTNVYVSEGQTVSRGQRLATMDDTQPRNTLAAAQAALNQARDAHARMKVLHEAAALSDVDWVDTQSKLAQAEATVAAAKKAIADCVLTAPCAGVVGGKPMEAGSTALPSQTVVTLLDISAVKVRAAVPEKEIASVTAASRATATVDALPGETFAATKIEKAVEADAVTRTYNVRATIANAGRRLLPGMVARLTIAGQAGQAADGEVMLPSVPVRAVQQDAKGSKFVWTVVSGTAHRQRVTLGDCRGDRMTIASGLTAGERVITAGYQKVSEGSKIREI